MNSIWGFRLILVCGAGALSVSSFATILQFGDKDVVGTRSYASEPTAGATLQGLAENAVTYATLSTSHSYPFSPSPGDFPGTDQIYVGSHQTTTHDGYSRYAGRKAGPMVLSLDCHSLLTPGTVVTSVTLGIGADDFEYPRWGQAFQAKIDGVVSAPLSNALNSLHETGPYTRFFSLGLRPTILSASSTLTISIDSLGDGGDGWAVDFLTVGVGTRPVPEPATFLVLGLGTVAFARRRKG